MVKCRVSKNTVGKVGMVLCWNDYVCMHFEKLLRWSGIKVLKVSVKHSPGILNAMCKKKKKKFWEYFSVCHSIKGNKCFYSGFHSLRKLQSSNLGSFWQWSYSLFVISLCQNTFMLKYIYNYIASSFSPPPAKSIPQAQAGQRLSSGSLFLVSDAG